VEVFKSFINLFKNKNKDRNKLESVRSPIYGVGIYRTLDGDWILTEDSEDVNYFSVSVKCVRLEYDLFELDDALITEKVMDAIERTKNLPFPVESKAVSDVLEEFTGISWKEIIHNWEHTSVSLVNDVVHVAPSKSEKNMDGFIYTDDLEFDISNKVAIGAAIRKSFS